LQETGKKKLSAQELSGLDNLQVKLYFNSKLVKKDLAAEQQHFKKIDLFFFSIPR